MLKSMKLMARTAAEGSVFMNAARSLYRNDTLVLMYHGVCESGSCHKDWLQVTQSEFRRQMTFLKHNHDVISLHDAINDVEVERKHAGPKIVITFDDGYANNYTHAYPVLKSLDLPATIFVVTDRIDSDQIFWYDKLFSAMWETKDLEFISETIHSFKDMSSYDVDAAVNDYLKENNLVVPKDANSLYRILSSAEIGAMDSEGLVSFGSHTADHELMTTITPEQAADTMKRSFDYVMALESGVPVMCFPNGWFHDHHLEIAKQIGYKAAVRADHSPDGLWSYNSQKYDIPRWGIGRNTPDNKFRAIVSGAYQALRKVTFRN